MLSVCARFARVGGKVPAALALPAHAPAAVAALSTFSTAAATTAGSGGRLPPIRLSEDDREERKEELARQYAQSLIAAAQGVGVSAAGDAGQPKADEHQPGA